MKYFFYEINNSTKKFNIICNSNSKTECKNIIKNNNKNDCFYILLKIKNKKGNIIVRSTVYSLYNNKLIKSLLLNDINYDYYLDMTGEILFSKKFLLKKKWSNNLLDDIIYKLILKKVSLCKSIITKYNVVFI